MTPIEIRSSGTPTAIGTVYPYRAQGRSMVGITDGPGGFDRLLTPDEARKEAEVMRGSGPVVVSQEALTAAAVLDAYADAAEAVAKPESPEVAGLAAILASSRHGMPPTSLDVDIARTVLGAGYRREAAK